jgi:predicted fused transcriptional regulator/phosphomethylpyrimidine kinase
MTMSESSLIKDYARKECIVGLMSMEHAHGKAVTNLVVDATVEAIAIYLKGSIGAEAAFNVLTRHADEIIRPQVEARVKHQ